MHIDVIEDMKALEAVRADWDAVYAADPEAHIFLSWDWTSAWLRRWDFIWLVLAAKPSKSSKHYVAFLPLQVSTEQRKDGSCFNEMLFGNWELADLGGLLCSPDHQEDAIPAFAKRVKQMAWGKLLLRHMSAKTRRVRLFTKAFTTPQFTIKDIEAKQNQGQTICNIFPYIELPADWDTYVHQSLSANTRQKAKRFLKRLDETGEFRITIADNDTVEADVDRLLRFWDMKWTPKSKPGALNTTISNYRVMLIASQRAGALYMPTLWQGDRPLCVLGTLVDKGKKSLHFLIGGRDETYNSPPTGFMLHCHSIRWAIANGFKIYDFLQGNEPYKYMFGSNDRYVKSVLITTKNNDNIGGKLHPRCLYKVLDSAKELQKAGKIAEAERAYRQILDVDPKFASALYLLGKIRAATNDIVEAEKLFKAYLEIEPQASGAWLRLGKVQQAKGDARSALASFHRVLAIDPGNKNAAQLMKEVSPLDDLLSAALSPASPSTITPLKLADR